MPTYLIYTIPLNDMYKKLKEHNLDADSKKAILRALNEIADLLNN